MTKATEQTVARGPRRLGHVSSGQGGKGMFRPRVQKRAREWGGQPAGQGQLAWQEVGRQLWRQNSAPARKEPQNRALEAARGAGAGQSPQTRLVGG